MKILKCIIILLLSITAYCQQDAVVVTYRVFTPSSSEDTDGELRDVVLNSMQYSFATNETACYLNFTAVPNISGVIVKETGEEHIFINYSNKTALYKLEGDCMKFALTKFKKVNFSETIMGMKVNKYVSDDKNLEVYTADSLPWYVQPCLFTSNELGAGVIKFVNHSANFGFMMVGKPTVTKDKEIGSKLKRVAAIKNCPNTSNSPNPFFKGA